MSEALRWWFILLVAGGLQLPLCLALFRRLPDRGYSLSKPFGLLLLGFAFWFANSLRLLPNHAGAILFVLLLLAAVGALFAYRERDGMLAWGRANWRYIVAVEAVFALVFVTAAWLRSTVGNIQGTEQPMDLMFLNAVVEAEHFPPKDPWLSGHTVAYYYGGYLLIGLLSKLSGVVTSVGYNLGLATIASMAFVGAGGLVFNLVHMHEEALGRARAVMGGRLRAERVRATAVSSAGAAATFYDVLGVERDASGRRIRSAYRYMSRKLEQGGVGASVRIEQVEAAFATLSDPQRRAAYNRTLSPDGDGEARRPAAATDGAEASGGDADLTSSWRPAAFGLAGAVMLVLMGNLVFVLTYASAFDIIRSQSFFDWVNVNGLNANELRHAFYPAEFFEFFTASRIYPLDSPPNKDDTFRVITEFPMFSFILGDLHPHVMALPFVLLAVGLALSFYRSDEPLDIVFWLQRPLALVAGAVVIGALSFINTWDIATLTFVVAAAAFVSNFGRTRAITVDLFVQVVSFVVPLLIVAVLLYLPFYVSFTSQASGIAAVVTNDRITVAATRPLHLLLFWGPLFAVTLPFVALRLLAQRERVHRTLAAVAAAPAVAVVLGWALLFLFQSARGSDALGRGYEDIVSQISDRGVAWLTALALSAALTAALAALWLDATDDGADGRERRPVLFALGLIATALLLILGTEFFFVDDVFHARMNTVFKLYYQAWLLLAVGAGFALYYAAGEWRFELPRAVAYRRGWLALAGVVLAGAMLYPVGGSYNRTRPYDASGNLIETGGKLDGLAYADPDERAAWEYLRDAVKNQDAVLVEAVGNDYTYAGRVSMATGIPTVLGWKGHEDQWRGGNCKPCAGRFEAVGALYQTDDVMRMNQIFQEYGITHVYVGPLERSTYGEAGLAKFQALPVAYQSPGGIVTIYRVAGARLGEVSGE